MNDNGFSNNVLYGKAAGQKQRNCGAIVSEERRQVSGVAGMLAAARVIVRHGVCKGILRRAAAFGSLVNMKSENPFMTRAAVLWKAADPGADNHAAAGLKKAHFARQAGIMTAARNAGRRLRPAAQNGKEPVSGGDAEGWFIHKNTPYNCQDT